MLRPLHSGADVRGECIQPRRAVLGGLVRCGHEHGDGQVVLWGRRGGPHLGGDRAGLTGEIVAEHALVAPGETSIVDAHYGGPRPDTPRRAPRPRTATEKAFLALGPVAEQFLTGAAAAGVSKLPGEIEAILALHAAHGTRPLLAALERAVAFRRWRAADVRAILATNGHAPRPTGPGQALVLTLPVVPTRSLDAYRVDRGGDPA